MFELRPIARHVLFACGGTATLALLAVPAAAQTQPQVQEAVTITGSRIASPNAESASPLQVFTAKDIQDSGVTNIQDLLIKNPTTSASFSTRTNSNFVVSGNATATVDLRNLGTSRTLVLVNGRRYVAGLQGSSAVDLNTIPTDFIERVELLTGGASSMYGSDAVAGVVNIILKRDYEGLVFDAKVGQTDKDDNKTGKFSATWGANVAGGKGNVMAHFGYSKEGEVLAKNRSGLERDNISDAFLTGTAGDMFSFTTPFYSSFTPAGRVFIAPGVSGASRTFDAAGNIIPVSTNGPAGDGVNATGFNRQDFRTLAVPVERYLLATKADFEVVDNHRAFVEGTYAATSIHSRLEPFPFAATGSNSPYPGTNQVPAEFLVNGALLRNPLIPAGIYNLLSVRNADGALVYDFTKRLSEVGSRGNDANRDTFRVVSGLKGLVFKSWDYEVYGGYGATKESQSSSGQINVLNVRNALEAIPDVNDINGNGNTTEAICRDADARAQGCVPLNVFGINKMSAAALKYIVAPSLVNTVIEQKLAGATLTGEAFKLPAGPLGVAVGFEYRKEYSKYEFDALAQAGLNGSNATPTTVGNFDVKELFGEVKIPLLKDMPFAKALNFSAAVRAGDYSTVGNTTSWNAGFDWSPNSDIRLRATRALSTRAPNIGELFQPATQNFPTVTDPCVGVTATSTGATAEACRRDPGVAANIAANGAFTLNQADIQGVSGFDRGNPNLKEEKGKSFTAGIVLTPRSLPVLRNFTFTVDYFKIDIDKAIVQTPRQFILQQCYGGDASFCQFVTRRPAPVGANSAGSIFGVDSAQTNSGGVSTEGVDFTSTFSDRVGPGRLNARLAWTYLMKGYVIPLPGADRDNFVGEIGAARNRGSLALGYSWGPFGVNSQFTYIGKSALDDQFLAGFCVDGSADVCVPAPAGSVTVPAKIYTDLQLSYSFRKAQFYVGVDNLFDTKAPRFDTNGLIPGAIANANVGTGTSSEVYDPIGRRYSVGIRMNF